MTTSLALAAAATATSGAVLLGRPRAWRRWGRRAVRPGRARRDGGSSRGPASAGTDGALRWEQPRPWWVTGGIVAAAVWVWSPSVPGGVLAVALGAAVPLLVRRAVLRRSARQRATGVRMPVPLAADLVVAALDAGVPLAGSVAAVADAVGGPLGASLREVCRLHDLGADMGSAVSAMAADPDTARVARALARAASSGMPPAEVLRAAAESERSRRGSARVARARGTGSLAALPVGLLILPAFVLVAVVPMVVGGLGGVLSMG